MVRVAPVDAPPAPAPSAEAAGHAIDLYGEDFLVDESLWRGKAPGRPFGLEGKGRPLAFRLLHVIEFAPSGDIRRENVWVDLAAIIQQLPQG